MAGLVQTPGTATVNQLRTNTFDNETAINAEVEQATADVAAHKVAGNTDHDGRYSKITDLNTHKSSSDHDGRYYSEAEIDAMVAKLTGAQDIAGIKTFFEDLIVKKASPAFELRDAAGSRLARLVGSTDSDNSALLQVYDTSAGQYVTILKVQKNGTISDSGGNALASQAYSDARTKSWKIAFHFTIVQTIAASQSYVLSPSRIVIPVGARLTNVLNMWDFSGWEAGVSAPAAANYVFNQYTSARVVLRTGALSGADLPVYLDVQAVAPDTETHTGYTVTTIWTAQIGTFGVTDVDGNVTLVFNL